jgi:hypothetical protein
MYLKPMSPEMNELRKVIISSSLTTCYLMLEVLRPEGKESSGYQQFKDHWIDVYKSTYGMVSKMKPRKASREETPLDGESGKLYKGLE